MSNLKRAYLSDSEENFYMVTKSFIQMCEGLRSKANSFEEEVWVEWTKRGMMTSGMKKNIKMAYTYLNKFADELFENLDEKQQEKLTKRLNKYDFRIVDDYKMQMIFRDIRDRLNNVVIKRKTFENILVEVTQVECVGCDKDYKKCDLFNAIEESLLPYIGEKSNCPYAVDLSKFSDEEKNNYNELLKRIKKKNIFFKK